MNLWFTWNVLYNEVSVSCSIPPHSLPPLSLKLNLAWIKEGVDSKDFLKESGSDKFKGFFCVWSSNICYLKDIILVN